ncbi:MAG TPA: AAA-like domain-containing protein [Nostocaceae cyanobacterium]|nr:AAA-like domain-containing protein [Nostocaceae cyanobacterium]
MMPAKILVVDDEPDLEALIRQKFRKEIRRNQIEFIFSRHGLEALNQLAIEPDIDIVLTDINMPQMDGLTLLDQIKLLYPTVTSVIISAYGDMTNIRTAMNRGAFDFLTKPINLDDLEITTQKTLEHVQKLKTALEQERLARQAQTQLLIHLQQEITERQRAEEALRDNEKKLAQLLEAVPVGIFVIDRYGKSSYANQTAVQILGKAIEPEAKVDDLTSIYQAYVAGTQQIYPPDKQPIALALRGESVSVDDVEIHQGDKVIPLEVSATPIFDEQGQIAYAIAAFQDITQRKQSEAERVKFTEELAIKNTDLQQAKDKLAQANQTLEEKVIERTKELSQTLEILKATQAELVIENALLRSAENISAYEYQVGGSLPMNAPTYVVRQADRYLYKALKRGEFCYILNARQMGKSSLRVQIMNRLQMEGFICVAMDLSEIGNRHISMEQWYAGFTYILASGFNLITEIDVITWWREHQFLSPIQRLGTFINEVLLEKIPQNIVIFIDEIDSIFNLNFEIDDFFILLRSCFNKRADSPKYQRLTFVLLGVATPSQLLQDKNRTPFNIGQLIELHGFQLHEAQPLLQGLINKVSNPQTVLKELLEWTNGQPFLTQKLCKLIGNSSSPIPSNKEVEWIENLVQTKVVVNWESQDEPEHLRTIRDRILSLQRRDIQVLKLYQEVIQHEEVAAVDSLEERELLLSGLVVKQEGILKVHNRIYQRIFDSKWVDKILNS